MEDDFVQRFLAIRIGGRYQLRERLGEGGMGLVYLGYDIDSDHEVAIKLEHFTLEIEALWQENHMYKSLLKRPGFPRVFWYGEEGEFKVMVVELLGPSLYDLLKYCGGTFSMKTTLMLMDQMIRRLESLHEIHCQYRDVKPDNFLMGAGRNGNVVYLTDMGLSYPLSPDEMKAERRDLLSSKRRVPIGTYLFTSINGHLETPFSFCDDLEALIYVALYFLRGSLPWEGAQEHEQALEQKQQISVEELCQDLPPEFATMMNYLSRIQKPNHPDYSYIRKLFDGLFRRLGFKHDQVFDWTIIEFERLSTCKSLDGRVSDE